MSGPQLILKILALELKGLLKNTIAHTEARIGKEINEAA